MSRWRIVLAGTAVAVAFAACSSGDNSAPNTATAATTVATTTVADPTTAVSSTTTALPTTTLDPAITLAAEVEADLRAGLAAARTAGMDPFDQAAETEALRFRTGFARENLESRLANWRERNLAILENELVAPSVTIEIPAEFVAGSEDEVAQVQVCEVDSWILVEVGAGPNGTDAVVSPDVLTYRTMFFLRFEEDVWRIEGANELARWEGATACDGPSSAAS